MNSKYFSISSHLRKVLISLLGVTLITGGAFAGINTNNDDSDPDDDGDKNCEELAANPACISYVAGFPVLPLEDALGAQNLRYVRDDPTPALFTPQALSYSSVVLSFVSSIETGPELPSGISYRVSVTNKKNEPVTFEVETGATEGSVVGAFVGEPTVLELIDENGDPVAVEPAFFRIHRPDGSIVDYRPFRGYTPSRMRTAEGRLIDFGALLGDAFDVVLEEGFYRQIKSATGLLDIVTVGPQAFEVRFYTPENAGAKSGGLYQPTGEPYRVISFTNPTGDPDRFDRVRIVDSHGAYSDVSNWEYVQAAQDWALTREDGILTERIVITEDTSGPVPLKIKVKELLDAEGQVVSKIKKVIAEYAWNGAVVEEIEDPDGEALTTYIEYYTDASETGRYGNVRQEIRPDGSWIRYDYDTQGRKTSEIRPWQDAPVGSSAASAVETAYSYVPVDPADVVEKGDARPRTVIERSLGIETSRRYHAYYENASGEYVEVEETAIEPGATYGDPSNLRSVKVYYAANETAERAGRLKSETRPDGVATLYDYAPRATGGGLVVTADTLALSGGTSVPVAGKSTRIVKAYDDRNNRIEESYFVHDGVDWRPLYVVEQDFSEEFSMKGNGLIERRKDGRVVLNQTWTGPLVSSMTDEAGTVTTYFHDALDRLELEIKSGHGGRPDILTAYDRSLGAIDCGCDGQRIVTRTAGGLELTSHQKTDAVGRRSEVLDENGHTTTYAYQNGGRITTETRPDGSTRITENYRDGRLKSVTGTGVIPEYYSYGVNPDGTQTTRVETATQGSPRHRETTVDLAGRLIREEAPAATGGLIVRTMGYDDRGLLAKQTETGRADTLFEYDALADLVRSGLDIDADGQLTPASPDRITDTDTVHQQDGSGDWFEVTTTAVYPETGSADAVTVATQKLRLSGFTTDATLGTLAAEQITIDVRGNETIRRTWIDRPAKTVTRVTDTPDSTIDAVATTVNGLLLSQNTATVAAPTTFDYDPLERRISVKDPRHTQAATTEYYPGTRQVFTQTDAAGNTTAFEYHGQGQPGAGQVKTVTDPLLQKSHFAYDLLGRQIRTWGETDYPQESTYNAFGELATLTTWRDAADSIDFSTATWPAPTGGDTTTWTYDAATGLLSRKEYADGNGTDYTYDAANRLAVRTWARSGGLDTSYGYDPATGELLTVDYEDPDTSDISYTYDRLGRQATVTDATGTRSFAYDPATLEQVEETLDATFYDGMALTRSHDPLGRASGYTLGAPTSLSASYGYDTAGRLQTVSDATHTFTYAYAPDSNLLASVEGPVHAVAFDYEPNRDVMTEIDNRANDLQGASISKYAYTYDALARRDDRSQSGSAINTPSTDDFAYNPRSEVTGSTNSVETTDAWNPTYAFDKIGNRETSTGYFASSYTANELNQYTQVSSLSPQPSYDADGNLTGYGSWTYTRNGENRLINADNGTVSIDFTYDYQGRLVKKDDGTDIEVYVYDGWNRIATFKSQVSGFSLQTSYLWGLDLSGSMQGAGGVGGLLSETTHSSPLTTHYSLFDANGNIMQKLDGTGAVVMSVDYDPFGNIIDGTLVGEYGFSTKPLIGGIQWYYYGFRYYDPVTGRWPSRDPIGEQGHQLMKSVQFSGSNHLYQMQLSMAQATLNNIFAEYKAAFASAGRSDLANVVSQVEVAFGGIFQTGQISLTAEELNLYLFVRNNPISIIDPNGEFGFIGAAIGAAVGGVVGGVTAAVNGQSVAAGIAGGAIGGAIAGSGAGLIAGAVTAGGSLVGAAAGTAALGAAGGAVGNATTQVGNGLAQGQSLGQAASNINGSQVATSAALGGAASLVGGGVGGLSQAVRNSTSALQSQMSQSLNSMSQTLRNMGASQTTIHNVQNMIVSGASQAGHNQANVLAAVAALNSAGLPVTSAAIENWINQNANNSGCP